MSGENLDITSDGPLDTARPADAASCAKGGRFLGVHFKCCGTYARIYPNKDNTAYVGNCPKCARQARVRIGEGGTDCRFFTLE